jgi:hypothetical protein
MPEQRRVNGDARMHEWKKPERNKQENATTTKKKRDDNSDRGAISGFRQRGRQTAAAGGKSMAGIDTGRTGARSRRRVNARLSAPARRPSARGRPPATPTTPVSCRFRSSTFLATRV